MKKTKFGRGGAKVALTALASTGVDGLATTAPFSAKPLDMSVRLFLLQQSRT